MSLLPLGQMTQVLHSQYWLKESLTQASVQTRGQSFYRWMTKLSKDLWYLYTHADCTDTYPKVTGIQSIILLGTAIPDSMHTDYTSNSEILSCFVTKFFVRMHTNEENCITNEALVHMSGWFQVPCETSKLWKMMESCTAKCNFKMLLIEWNHCDKVPQSLIDFATLVTFWFMVHA